jgi:hypothetical protein
VAKIRRDYVIVVRKPRADAKDPKKFMVIVKESKIEERAGRSIQFADTKLPEDEFLNGLVTGETFKKYGYDLAGERVITEPEGQEKIIFELQTANGPNIEIVVYGKIVNESKVKECDNGNCDKCSDGCDCDSEEAKKMFVDERAEHPSFTDEQIWQIVKDHLKPKTAKMAMTQKDFGDTKPSKPRLESKVNEGRGAVDSPVPSIDELEKTEIHGNTYHEGKLLMDLHDLVMSKADMADKIRALKMVDKVMGVTGKEVTEKDVEEYIKESKVNNA